MKTESYNDKSSNRVLSGMILERSVISRVSAIWTERGMFSNAWANTVGQWCVDHFRKYGDPLERGVTAVYESWAEGRNDTATVELIGTYLSTLSAESKEEGPDTASPDLLVDLAGQHFNKVRAEKLANDVLALTAANRIDDATKLIAKFSRVEAGIGSGIDFFNDEEAQLSTFADDNLNTVINFDGPLGVFFRGEFQRDSLISFLAPTKRGKSFWLIDVAFRAVKQRRKVAYFQIGDMSETQVKLRLSARVARHPVYSTNEDQSWPCQVKVPTKIIPDRERKTVDVEYDVQSFDKPLRGKRLVQACKDLIRYGIKSKKSYFRMSTHPNGSIGMPGIKAILESWENRGFCPEVVILDYADLLEPIDKRMDKRDQINDTWKAMRRMSQERHCCLVTATQSDTDGFNQWLLDRTNFSEDKRKLDTVTGMIGINVTAQEKELGVCRLNWIELRGRDFSPRDYVYVAGCLSFADPYTVSFRPAKEKKS